MAKNFKTFPMKDGQNNEINFEWFIDLFRSQIHILLVQS